MKMKLIKNFLLTGSALLLASTVVSAATTGNETFKISSKIFIDGKLVSSPKLIAPANKHATLTTSSNDGADQLKIDVIAKNTILPDKRDAIQMNFDIQIQEDGKTIHTRPVFLVVPGKEGILNLSSDSHKSLLMKVMATKD